ncbi:hypothetical protein [Pseudoflavonifractor sp. MSJ-37]|uniref:hypothetical protein n=1 Tax=Pseudoflavonifractor sp. MSJ-37 TaxID=2841531 RepID=UPI001C11BF26|nr:hypothetical protein [Pseudoflavonifractor sp. MSJ-37]MBU5436077.1 hypothetical protein [Pseudoflavonifractor sp. MSJ-37]
MELVEKEKLLRKSKKELTNGLGLGIIVERLARGALLEAESFGGDRAEAGRTRGAG